MGETRRGRRGDRLIPVPLTWTIDDHLRGKSEHLRSLFRTFVQAIELCGPYWTSVTKTAVSFKGAVRGFAGVTPRASHLSGFLDLMEEMPGAPFTRVSPYTSKLWVHRFVIDRNEQIDARFVALIAEAYQVGQGAHRA